MGLNSINEAKQILQGYAPPGESLAFINPSEAQALKGMGGSGTMTEAGIPTYFGGIGSWIKETTRKAMPNELAEFGGKIAPIVSMMGPWGAIIGAGLTWNANFDKTGRIGSSLKAAAKTYAIGKVGQAVGGAMTGSTDVGLSSLGDPNYWTDVGFTRTGLEGAAYTPYSLNPAAASAATTIPGTATTTPIDPANPLATGQYPTTTLPSGDVYYTPDQLATQQAATGQYPEMATEGVYDFEPTSVEHRPTGDPAYVTEGDPKALSGGTENTKNFTWEKFKEFWDASATEKWDMATTWFDSLDDVTKLELGVGTVTAALQYLENKAMEDERINVPDYKDIEAMDYATRGRELNVNPIISSAPTGSQPYINTNNLGSLVSGTGGSIFAKDGGIIGLAQGGEPMVERDYRPGGFIPVGAQERADDVPARLSKNEFVMTADAVRAAGGGSIDLGSQRMYDLMNNLEAAA